MRSSLTKLGGSEIFPSSSAIKTNNKKWKGSNKVVYLFMVYGGGAELMQCYIKN